VTGEWRRIRNKELNDLLTKYNSGDHIKIMRYERHFARMEERSAHRVLVMRHEGHVARVEERRNAHRVSVGKREGK